MESELSKQLQLLYEISMEIGNNLDMRKMLRTALSTINSKLCCSLGAIIEYKNRHIEKVFSIPANPDKIDSYQLAIKTIRENLRKTGNTAFCKQLPLLTESKINEKIHIMELPEFGFLILIKAANRISEAMIRSFKQINIKLANACIACKAQEELIKSEITMRKIVENMPVMMNAFDSKGNIIVWNTECEKVTGYSSDEIVGNSNAIELLYPDPEYRIKILSILQRNSGYYRNLEWDITSKTGETKTILWSNISRSYPVPGWYSWVIGLNISNLKKLEETLRQSEKMQAIGQLAGGIAHDFNNQLTGIVGFSDLLQEELNGNDRLKGYVGNILKAAKRSVDLTSKLLAFARKGKYLSVPIDLNKIIIEVSEILYRSIDKKIKIKTCFHITPAAISGDPTLIHSALLNLAINARDAMPKGGEIVFTTDIVNINEEYRNNFSIVLEDGDYIKLSVSDNGNGINENIIKHIFEPFFTTKQHGTGMGLAAVFGTIDSHHGQIKVDSSEGKGTTFQIYLPASNVIISKKVEEKTLHNNRTETRQNILLIDDEEIVCELAKEMLINLGYNVSVFTNGIGALDKYKKEWRYVDLIILDMIMPQLSGEELFYKMKKINPNFRVLLSSGYSINESIQNLIKEGKHSFIQKPYRKKVLEDKINSLLKMH